MFAGWSEIGTRAKNAGSEASPRGDFYAASSTVVIVEAWRLKLTHTAWLL